MAWKSRHFKSCPIAHYLCDLGEVCILGVLAPLILNEGLVSIVPSSYDSMI